MNLAIIFDLDGTLWDSRNEVVPIWNLVFSRYPEIPVRITEEDMLRFMGRTIWDIAAELLPELSPEARNRIMRECSVEETRYLRKHGATLFPRLKETLDKLQTLGYPLYIVSNCQDGYIEAFLEAHHLADYFLDFECPGRTGLSKGQNIKLVMERNQLKKVVYIGDTLGDYSATQEANVPFIHASYGFGQVPEAKYRLREIAELPQLLNSIPNP
ncbi:MAG: HAD family hydrolase [Petrimonas sp.]|jgi:phosphoglycolate phosphatase|nr:HAD family hydrolase [Petrimonas sp.]